MTSDQESRIREVLEIFGNSFGIDFVETQSSGTTIVVGDTYPGASTSSRGDDDLAVYFPNPPPGSSFVSNTNPIVIFDGNENWYNGFGKSPTAAQPSFFEAALVELGRMLGLGDTADLPNGTYMGFEPLITSTGVEWTFPGDNDVIHGQYLYKPEALDVDLYRFDVQPGKGGKLSAEVVANRLVNASLLNSKLALFKLRGTPWLADTALTVGQEINFNGNLYAVTKAGDSGTTAPSHTGGAALALNVTAPKTPAEFKYLGNANLELVATNDDYFGSDSFVEAALEPGVYYVAVSSEGNQFDPNSAATGSGGTSEGAYKLQLNFTPFDTPAIIDSAGSAIDGDRDGIAGGSYNFWFNVAPANKTIFVHKGMVGVGNGTAAAPYRELDTALASAAPGDIIRVLGDKGSDGNLSTATDSRPYLVGRANNADLQDGRTVEVPAGVTLMIDAGAVFKSLGGRIAVGSDANGANRLGSSIQVLGRPGVPVNFTSYNDRTIGTLSNPINVGVSSGDWGGIEIRGDVDRDQGRVDLEREGVFMNYVSNSVFNYGGGVVTFGGAGGRAISPISVSSQRPEISYNKILNSANSAVSADPNSFEYTTFTEQRYQQHGEFIADYSRIGPDLHRNQLQGNSINGLFIRIDTQAGGALEKLEVPARFDDTDIVYVLGESLLLNGTAGGPFQESSASRPPIDSLGSQAVNGTLGAGTYYYSYTYVDAFGNESLPSQPFAVTLGATGGINLLNLPSVPANRGFVGRRLYRGTLPGV